MHYFFLKTGFVAYCLGSSLFLTSTAQAQVTPDGSLNTQITSLGGRNFIITHGTTAGSNLFHSFRDFSIPTSGSATFNLTATPNVTTIFSRVTGNSVSSIDGLIRTSGSTSPVSLFLLNPNGVVFGPNAVLNIGGSLIGTTADRIRFADGVEFSATNTAPPLLTISTPMSLQFGQTPSAIRVQGAGHNLTTKTTPALTAVYQPAALSLSGLRVQTGRTIALVGAEVTLNGGLLYAPAGNIEVGSVGAGQVGIRPTAQGYTFDFTDVASLQNVQMAQRSLLDVGTALDPTRRSAGSIQVQGHHIRLSEGSLLLSQQSASRPAGELMVRATGVLEILGTAADEKIPSGIVSDTFASGASATLNLSAKGLVLQNGAMIGSRAFTNAPTGAITINATDFIQIGGTSPNTRAINILGTIIAHTNPPSNAPVKAGNITISTKQLSMQDGSSIGAISLGAGLGGDIVINADTVELVGGAKETVTTGGNQGSSILSISYRYGDSGAIALNTRTLALKNGGFFSTSNLGIGNSGSITVNASESVQLSNQALVNGWYSNISSTLTGVKSNRQFYNPSEIVRGNAGGITINTPSLQLNQATITVSNSGFGAAGSLIINADSIKITNSSNANGLIPSGITAATFSGGGGNIILNAQRLLLRNNSVITTNAQNGGNGGNIKISAPLIVGTGNSDIIANAAKGQGGNIQVTTQGIFGLAFRDLIKPREVPTNDITASSESRMNGNVQITTVGIDPNAGLVELPVDLIDASQQVAKGCADNQDSSFSATGRGGMAINPLEETKVTRTWSDMRTISPLPTDSPPAIRTAVSPLVEATHWRKTAMGKVELVADQGARDAAGFATCQTDL